MEFMSKEGYDKLVEELRQLTDVELPRAKEALVEAREKGDLSENFEYHAARKAKGENDSRIRYLENMIRTAVIVEDRSGEDQVGLEKRVVVRFPDEGEEESYKIVTSVRGNSLQGLITPESPLGSALMGHRPGDTVHVRINENAGYDVQIVSVSRADDEEESIRKF